MTEFVLHPRLAADTAFIADWPLSRVLLMNDARFPWLILVPRRDGLSELHDLTSADAGVLTVEIRRAGAKLKELTDAAKINTAALGNQVPQLHIHVIARQAGDPAWPGPVWGHGAPTAYTPQAQGEFISRLRMGL